MSKALVIHRQSFLAGLLALLAACNAFPPLSVPVQPSQTIPATLLPIESLTTATNFLSPSPSQESLIPNPSATPLTQSLPSANPPTNKQTATPKATPNRTPPPVSSDLLFISQNDLMRWDHVTGFTGLLVEGVEDYAASLDGKTILLLRLPENDPIKTLTNYRLDVLDLDSKTIRHIEAQTSRYTRTALSPDGAWVAYTLESTGKIVYALNLLGDNSPIEIGECRSEAGIECQSLVWSPDSRALLWSDARGVWLSFLSKTSTHLVHPNKIEVADPKGEIETIQVLLTHLAWSPAGRYALVTVIPDSSHVRWQAVLDTGASRLVMVPDTYESDKSIASLTWLPDGSLLMAHCGDIKTRQPPFVKIWRPLPTHSALLIQNQFFPLDFSSAPPTSYAGQQTKIQCPAWPEQIDSSAIRLGIGLPLDTPTLTLVELFLKDGSLAKICDIPNNTTDVLWSPDRSGALVIGGSSQLLYTPLDGSALINLLPILGEDAHHFHWLPPAPRD